MDNLINMKQCLDISKKKQWLKKSKNKVLYFWNKHTFHPLHSMIEGNYLKQHEETAGSNLYYTDYKRQALISAFCIVWNCLTPSTITEKNWGKEEEMSLINHDMH